MSWIVERNRTSVTGLKGKLSRLGGLMTMQRDQNRQSDFLHGTMGQLMLLGAATIVLLFFAWIYLG
jgi:hypothetical protein